MSLLGRLLHRFAPPAPARQALPPMQHDSPERFDGWANAVTGLGSENDRTTCNMFTAKVYRSDDELEAVYQGSALMARFVDLEPNTCMAKGFQVTELADDDITAFESEMLRLNAFRHIADARRWARLYGGAIVFMQINDGRIASQPVDESTIVNIRSLTVFDRTELSVSQWNDDIGSDNYGMPEVYRVSSWGKTFEVHHSRVLRFDGAKVSRKMRRHGQGDGFGTSVVDQVWDAFMQYGTTHAYLNGAVSKITQGVLKLKNLNESLLTSKYSKIVSRIRAIIKSMSVIGDIVIDADSEEYTVIQRPMTGFAEAGSVSEARLVGEMGVPKSLLMMQAPGGLSNGENGGDWQYWSVSCGSEQQQVYEPEVKKLVRLSFLSRNSPVIDPPQDFTITWPPIMQMTEKEKAEIFALRAPGRASDILSGVITASQAQQADDVIEAYRLGSGLSGGSIQPDVNQPPELRVVGT